LGKTQYLIITIICRINSILFKNLDPPSSKILLGKLFYQMVRN